jgi:hypothetical protein
MFGWMPAERERQRPAQRMVHRQDDAAHVRAAREPDDLRERFGRIAGEAEVRLAARDPLRDLCRRALPDGEAHVRILLHEALDHRLQHVARVHVRRRDHHATLRLVRVLGADLLHGAGVAQHATRDDDDLAAHLGQAGDAVALAHEQVRAEFAFEHQDLLADPGLRGMQRAGRSRDAELPVDDAAQIAQLLECHTTRL